MNKRAGLEGGGIINRNTVLYRNFQGIINSIGKLYFLVRNIVDVRWQSLVLPVTAKELYLQLN